MLNTMNSVIVRESDFNDEDGIFAEMHTVATNDAECSDCSEPTFRLFPVISDKFGICGVCAKCAESYVVVKLDELYIPVKADGSVHVMQIGQIGQNARMFAISPDGLEWDITDESEIK
jgi:hypothetical protein